MITIKEQGTIRTITTINEETMIATVVTIFPDSTVVYECPAEWTAYSSAEILSRETETTPEVVVESETEVNVWNELPDYREIFNHSPEEVEYTGWLNSDADRTAFNLAPEEEITVEAEVSVEAEVEEEIVVEVKEVSEKDIKAFIKANKDLFEENDIKVRWSAKKKAIEVKEDEDEPWEVFTFVELESLVDEFKEEADEYEEEEEDEDDLYPEE